MGKYPSKKNKEEEEILFEEKGNLERLISAIKEKLGVGRVTYGNDSAIAEPRVFIPTGIPGLEYVLDREGRGWPCGRIVEIYGDSATAKSGIGFALIAQAQKMGGNAILYPTEGSFDAWLAEKYGVDLHKLIICDDETVEGVFNSFRIAMDASGSDQILVGVIDSIAGLTTKAELSEKDLKQSRAAQIRAMLMSSAMRRIGAEISRTCSILFCINQIRDNPDVLFGDKTRPPGGRALKFYTSIRLKLENVGKVYKQENKKKNIVGFKLKLTSVKNRLANPYQSVLLTMDYEKGFIDQVSKADDLEVFEENEE